MRGRNRSKSVAVESPDCFNFKSSETINERHVFEKLCLDTSLRGFSYDPTLLVDLDKVSSFDEACIRLTTKCGSIVTQLSSLGHNVTDFAVTSAATATGTLTSPKTPNVPKIPESPVSLFSSQLSSSSLYFLNSQTSPLLSPTSFAKPKFLGFDCMKNDTLTPQDNRNIRVMGELWDGLKKKNYTGMVAVARVTGSSLPNNRSKDHYSIKALTDTLLSNIKGYFMFQNFSSTFDKDFDNSGALNIGKNNNSEPGGEYMLYVVYRSKAADKNTKKAPLKLSEKEADKLSSPWSAYVSGSSRKLRHESGDSAVSSCSSISSSTSGGPSSFSVPTGKTVNPRLESPQDTNIAGSNRDKFTNPQSHSSPQILKSPPASQVRKLITPPSPNTPKPGPRVSPLQGVQRQKLFSPKSQTQSFSERNLRHHPYKQQQADSSSNIEPIDTVSKAINVALSSLSPKIQSQSLSTNQVKQQQKTPTKKQTVPQFDKSRLQFDKSRLQFDKTRLQQQKSQETIAKTSIISLTAKKPSTEKRVPITAPKSEGPTKNLRSHSSTISSLPKILRSSPAAPAVPAVPAVVSQRNKLQAAVSQQNQLQAAISQRNLRNSFTRK